MLQVTDEVADKVRAFIAANQTQLPAAGAAPAKSPEPAKPKRCVASGTVCLTREVWLVHVVMHLPSHGKQSTAGPCPSVFHHSFGTLSAFGL